MHILKYFAFVFSWISHTKIAGEEDKKLIIFCSFIFAQEKSAKWRYECFLPSGKKVFAFPLNKNAGFRVHNISYQLNKLLSLK